MRIIQTESLDQCWLRHSLVQPEELRQHYKERCGLIQTIGHSVVLDTAHDELKRALKSLLGEASTEGATSAAGKGRIVIGRAGGSPVLDAALKGISNANSDTYAIQTGEDADGSYIALAGQTDRAVLYAVFHFARLLSMGQRLDGLAIVETPINGLRMINQWDNMDGSIERGYAGQSIFYTDNKIVEDLTRVGEYARLLASTGINGAVINNVNVHHYETRLITDEGLVQVKRVADVLAKYGITLFLSINFASPMELGGLDTADPLDSGVAQWWSKRAEAIYKLIPDFGGFLVKADSEFRPGPFTYGRNHADGANMLADALAPHGGIVVWRCFVYNCLQDWRDRKTDRARAAYDHFMPLDGQFKDNVILQIKNGPMDFQVREPVSPLLGGLRATNHMLELQVTQEYTGQQRHLCYLVPQWKEILDFDTHAQGQGSTIARVASGELFNRQYGGIAAVSNIGDDMNWTGHTLAQANLYGYGRLIWNPSLGAEEIAREWIQLTFSHDETLMEVLLQMLLGSWGTYENYTAPLGVGWMVNPNHHYGPNVDGYEYQKWGTYHFADCHGIGVDRTQASGTGYAGQYHKPHSDIFEHVETCPDHVLLFFHHVPYTHQLKSGKTVIQHIYDTHFEGVEQAAAFVQQWDSVQDKVDAQRHSQIRKRLVEQAEHAKEWRDIINTYFFRKSGIGDEHKRVIY